MNRETMDFSFALPQPQRSKQLYAVDSPMKLKKPIATDVPQLRIVGKGKPSLVNMKKKTDVMGASKSPISSQKGIRASKNMQMTPTGTKKKRIRPRGATGKEAQSPTPSSPAYTTSGNTDATEPSTELSTDAASTKSPTRQRQQSRPRIKRSTAQSQPSRPSSPRRTSSQRISPKRSQRASTSPRRAARPVRSQSLDLPNFDSLLETPRKTNATSDRRKKSVSYKGNHHRSASLESLFSPMSMPGLAMNTPLQKAKVNLQMDPLDDDQSWWDGIAVDECSLKRDEKAILAGKDNEYVIEIDPALPPTASMTFDVNRLRLRYQQQQQQQDQNKTTKKREPVTLDQIRTRNRSRAWMRQITRPPTPPRSRDFLAVSSPAPNVDNPLAFGFVQI